MKLEELLKKYGTEKKIAPLELNSKGICRFVINDEYLLSFEKMPELDGFYLYGSAGPLPESHLKELGLQALQGNLFSRETGHSQLGYVPATRSLVLFQFLEENRIEYPQFLEELDLFVATLVHWWQKIEAPDSTSGLSISKHLEELEDPKKIQIFFA